MSSFNKRFVVCAILFTCSITSSVLAGQKSGISQAKTISTFSKATGFGTSSSSIGNTMDVSDTEDPTTGGEITNPTRTCDFSGFPQRDSVNNAYAGGTSFLGASKSNQNIGFTNATVLNTFWGSNEPNQGIVFAPEGFLLVSLSSFSPNQISFAYTSSVTLTISEFTSANGTGTPINTWTTAKTMPYGPYTVWSTYSTALSANTRSITIAGTTDKWGIDQVVVQANSSDCNNNGVPDATDIANGTSQDCNGNGIPDSCDIASGNSRDVNLNGIPDECEMPVNLGLRNDAGACNHVGGSVNVDAILSGVISPIVSGQIYISWNPANMSLNSITAGDAPFDQLPLQTINQTAGTALLVTSIALGQPPVSVISKIVARMQFTIRGGTCDGSGTDVQFFPDGTLPTTFTDGLGSELVPALVASSGFKVDDTSPVFSNVPAAVSVNADAGEGPFARVALIAPTATDACGAVTQTSSRSDGAGMDAMYAVGTTTVTWSTTDLCGNSSTATTSVTVNPYNTARFQVQYVGVSGGAATRSFVTTLRGPQVSLPSTVNGVSIANGAGEFFVTNAPIDSYFCATVEDAASTLRRRVSVTDAGTEWNVVVTLLSGDVINDEVVDVLDWGAYVVRNVNADLNMDNSTNDTDGDMILAIFGQKGDTACGSNFTDSPEPVTSISIAELVDRGMADLVAADLNNDGWLDMADIELSRR